MPTENRNYNLPTKGSADWDVPLNENFQLIDADIQSLIDTRLEEVDIEDSGSLVGTATRFNFGDNLTATVTGETATITGAAGDGGGGDGGTGDVTIAPNDGLPFSDLPTNESMAVTQIVPDGATLTVKAWGAYTVPSATAPTGLDVQLVHPDESIIASENTVWTANANGIDGASHTNSSGGAQVLRLRVVNNTDTDYVAPDNDGVAADFGYEVA